MGVGALGVINRGVVSEIAPNHGRPPGMRRVRRLHRYLPGGRADQRHLPLPDAAVGDDPRRHHLHALRRRLQDHAGHAQRPHHPRQQSRPFRHQRRVPVHQGPLRLRFLRPSANGCRRRWCASTASWRRFPGRRRWRAVAQEVQPDAGRWRQLRRDRLQPHHQRREFLPAEVRARGAAHQPHRSSPHRRRGDAGRCAERQDRQAGHRGRPLRAQGRPGAGRRPGAGASAALLPDPRQLPASPGARLRGDAGHGARRQVRRGERSRRGRGRMRPLAIRPSAGTARGGLLAALEHCATS